MRWVMRAANQMQFDAVLSATGTRPIVDISARGRRWSAWPAETATKTLSEKLRQANSSSTWIHEFSHQSVRLEFATHASQIEGDLPPIGGRELVLDQISPHSMALHSVASVSDLQHDFVKLNGFTPKSR